MIDWLVVGAGLSGCTVAERLAASGRTVLVIDKRSHVAGNAYDELDADGVLVHKYGPHVLHTNSDEVFAYLSRFTAWRPYEHRVLASVNGTLLPVPFNDRTMAHFGGNLEAAFEAIVRPYTRKQWGLEPEELDRSVLDRIRPRPGTDDRYFLDKHQAMPADGFTALAKRMLDHPNIRIATGVTFADYVRAQAAGRLPRTDMTVYTGPIDEFYQFRLGQLPYRSAEFEMVTSPEYGLIQPVGVINYPAEHVPFTRTTEIRHLTGQRCRVTVRIREYPMASGDPMWPVPRPESAALYARYRELAKLDEKRGLHFCGRLGTYRYLNIDQAVGQALRLAGRLTAQEKSTNGHE